jgi:hypothetical protein
VVQALQLGVSSGYGEVEDMSYRESLDCAEFDAKRLKVLQTISDFFDGFLGRAAKRARRKHRDMGACVAFLNQVITQTIQEFRQRVR